MAEPNAPAPEAATDARRFLTFRVAEQLYALPAEEVTEVIRIPPVARLPQSPDSLLGLGNLRGSVIPIASARGLLGEAAAPPSRAIVLQGAAPVALAVDRVEALVTVDADRIDPDRSGLSAKPGERLRGAFQPPGRSEVAKILDLLPLVQAAFAPATRASRLRPATPESAGDRTPEATAGVVRLVTFEVSGQDFGLPLEDVREIIPAPDSVTPALRSEAALLGVTAYREGLLPLLSMGALLGLPAPPAADGREKVLVIAFGDVLAGLRVDRVQAVIAADPALLEPTPPMLAARAHGESRIASIYRGDGGRRLVSILSKDQLFREDVMQRLAQGQSPGHELQAAAAAAGAELRFLVFRLGDDEFGLPIDAVDEVARAPEQITRVPRTPKFLEGVINLRGEVLPVVDQRRRFDMPPSADLGARRLIVVRTERHRAGLIVDSVSEVLRASAEAIEPAPDLTGEGTSLVEAVVNLDVSGRIVLLLNPAELLTRAEHGLLDAFEADARQSPS